MAVRKKESREIKRLLVQEMRTRRKMERVLENRSTELYEEKARVERRNAALEAAIHQLKEAQGQLVQSEKMASLGVLSAGVAHEINNPVSFVGANLNTLQSYIISLAAVIESYQRFSASLQPEYMNSEQRSRLKELQQKIEAEDLAYILSDISTLIRESVDGMNRVTNIVQGLKTFAHNDTSAHGDVSLNECIDCTLNVLQHQLKHKYTLKLVCAPNIHIMGNRSQINQVIMNLIVNATQAYENGGEIIIRLKSGKRFHKIEVEDFGCGIPESNLAKLFSPFFTTKPVGQGTGLGLSVSYGIIKDHGGSISVKSVDGAGTTFQVKLPVPGSVAMTTKKAKAA